MVAKDYAAITTLDQLQTLVDMLIREGKPVGFDIETGYRGPDYKKRAADHWHADQFMVGFSLTNSGQWARYVPLRHDEGNNIGSIDTVWSIMYPLLASGTIVAHNAKFEVLGVRKDAGFTIGEKGGTIIDTMLDAYILGEWSHPNYRTMVGLKDLVLKIFGHQMAHIHDLWPDLPQNKYDFIRFNTLLLTPEVVSYACEDALWVLLLKDVVDKKALAERPLMHTLEHKIMTIMADVEDYGVTADFEGIKEAYKLSTNFHPNMERAVKSSLGELAGRDLSELNLNSAQQMKRLLYHDVGLSTTRQTAKPKADAEDWEKMSTDAKAMTELAASVPAIKKLLEFREVGNLSRRLKKWVTDYCNAADGRVHANYNQVVVGSGRFSANDPAIQQLPKKWYWDTGEKEKNEGDNGTDFFTGNFRDFVIARPGTYLLTFDYSQVELRMLTGASQEPALLKAFAEGIDVHKTTAAQMLGKAIEDIDEETERPIGKTFNFALLYGMGPKSLSEQLGVEYEKALELYKKYFSAYTRISSWMEQATKVGLEKGYAETIFGRRYTVWELTAPENTQSGKAIRAKGKRVLVNAPIQGSAADYMKFAMIRSYDELVKRGWWKDKCTMIMNQHDSLSFEVSNELDPNEVKAALAKCVVFTPKIMENYPEIVADWELGQRWGSSTKWDDGAWAEMENGLWTIKGGKIEPPKVTKPKDSGIIITLDRMPMKDDFHKFMDWLKDRPGDNKIKLVCPEGTVELPFTTSLDETAQTMASLLVGGARITKCK